MISKGSQDLKSKISLVVLRVVEKFGVEQSKVEIFEVELRGRRLMRRGGLVRDDPKVNVKVVEMKN